MSKKDFPAGGKQPPAKKEDTDPLDRAIAVRILLVGGEKNT